MNESRFLYRVLNGNLIPRVGEVMGKYRIGDYFNKIFKSPYNPDEYIQIYMVGGIYRDHNAGINLKQYGLKELGLGQSEFKPVEKTTSVSSASRNQVVSMKQEASKSLASR
jgi:hypothetical protein